MDHSEIIRAYESVAGAYDQMLTDSGWLRDRLWRRYRDLFSRGDRVLDVGCGTGIDARYLASRGVQVMGIDITPEMIEKFRTKAEKNGLSDRMRARVSSIDDLSRWPAATFDGIISVFASLNTRADLRAFAEQASTILKPEGRIILHMLNRSCIWEQIPHVLAGRWRKARRASLAGKRKFTVGDHPLVHYVWSAQETYRRFFADYFWLDRWFGMGVSRPVQSLPSIPRWIVCGLSWLDDRLGSYPPFRSYGRFFVLEMRPKAEAARGTAHQTSD